jgi:cytoskeletal protein CcmA (bactofilin family)
MWPPTLITEGTRMQGDLVFASQVHVYGVVEGTLSQTTSDALLVGKGGWVHGTIVAKGPVLVDGRVEGDVHSESRIRLGPSAIIAGSLYAPSIEIEAGARLEGSIVMKRPGAAAKAKAA